MRLARATRARAPAHGHRAGRGALGGAGRPASADGRDERDRAAVDVEAARGEPADVLAPGALVADRHAVAAGLDHPAGERRAPLGDHEAGHRFDRRVDRPRPARAVQVDRPRQDAVPSGHRPNGRWAPRPDRGPSGACAPLRHREGSRPCRWTPTPPSPPQPASSACCSPAWAPWAPRSSPACSPSARAWRRRSARSRRWARSASASAPNSRSPVIKDFVPLADLDDLVFGGWDVFPDDAYVAASRADVLDKHISSSSARSCGPSSRCPRCSSRAT